MNKILLACSVILILTSAMPSWAQHATYSSCTNETHARFAYREFLLIYDDEFKKMISESFMESKVLQDKYSKMELQKNVRTYIESVKARTDIMNAICEVVSLAEFEPSVNNYESWQETVFKNKLRTIGMQFGLIGIRTVHEGKL